MKNIMAMFNEKATNQNDAHAKALAYFLFREIIEDAHAKYNISQADMKSMCKEAVNRASAFLQMQNTDLYKIFVLNSIYGLSWDDIDNERVNEIIEGYRKTSKLS